MRPLTKDVSLRHDNGLWSVVAGHYVYAENLTFDDAMLERKRLIRQWIDTCSRNELEDTFYLEKDTVKIINLTPHPVVLNGHKFPRCENPLRLEEKTEPLGFLVLDEDFTVNVFRKSFVIEAQLPAYADDVFYIVPLLVAQSYDRDDFLVINEPIRDAAGNIIGCKSLAQVV